MVNMWHHWENPECGGLTSVFLDQPFHISLFIDYYKSVQKARKMFSAHSYTPVCDKGCMCSTCMGFGL